MNFKFNGGFSLGTFILFRATVGERDNGKESSYFEEPKRQKLW